ncbi:hypothetical protein [Pseudodesulfovibrio sediminis]|uniref:Uncharacterized protein n=1 Tax=Pseudodesulfovibrio sediminis TaxID=2810563 RepID=A0ABN6EQW0_9BACT|nr:hypothetical protein [Pseudodesulfovibrio sediminis]BCS88801.1 hypothetical protein PSDVSF_20430 [Pseudodesulfovibrio sediminis]
MVDAATNVAKVTDEIGDIWAKAPIERGKQIEDYLAGTEYKDWYRIGQEQGGYFPLVDFQKGNELRSLKTVDTTGSTWIKRMTDHIEDLGARGATIEGNSANMTLDLRVPRGQRSTALKALKNAADDSGVNLIVKEF